RVRAEQEGHRRVAVVLPGALPLEALAGLQLELAAVDRRDGLVERVLLELRIRVALLQIDELTTRAVGEGPPDAISNAPEVIVPGEGHERLPVVVRGIAGHVAE